MFTVFCSALAMFSCNCKTATKDEASKKSCCTQPTGEELIIVAHVLVHPEFKEELLNAFQAVVKGTHTEEGNISYDLYEDINNPLKFTFIEYWKSPAAIDAHNASAHFQEFAKAIEGKADLDVTTMKHKY
jgi:quinol monooxygenase YgiN